LRSAVLEQAIGKAASGCANVNAGSSGNWNLPKPERLGQLQASTADVRLVVAQEADGGFGWNGCSRLVHLLLPNQNPAGKDERPRPFAAGNQASLNQQNIHTGFFTCWGLFHG
jgi:hypothetical protein